MQDHQHLQLPSLPTQRIHRRTNCRATITPSNCLDMVEEGHNSREFRNSFPCLLLRAGEAAEAVGVDMEVKEAWQLPQRHGLEMVSHGLQIPSQP